MADPPDRSTADETASCMASMMQPDTDQASGTITRDESASTMHTGARATAAAPIGNDRYKDAPDAASEKDIVSSSSEVKRVLGAGAATSSPTSEEGTVAIATPVRTTTSLFAKFSGEIRNMIYRDYFEDFQQQRIQTVDFRKTAPTFLNLLHTDRMIRSEAGSIFYEENFPIDCFDPYQELPHYERPERPYLVMLSRIQAMCSLIVIRNVHTRFSIRVAPYHAYQTPRLLDFINGVDTYMYLELARKLATFISHEKNKPLLKERRRNPRSFAYKARIGEEYHIEYRGDGALSDDYSDNFLCIEGSLAELDWDKFISRYKNGQRMHKSKRNIRS